MFSFSRQLTEREITLRVGTKTVVLALAVRVVKLAFGNKFLILNNVYFILG